MSLDDSLEQEVSEERESRRLRSLLRETRAELEQAQAVSSLIAQFRQNNLAIPKWTRSARGRRGKHAIGTLQLSDTHFDETIAPEQIEGFNKYDRRIAEMRLERLADGTIKVARDYMAGVEYEGLAILATGDIFSGDIHEELARTNEGTLFEGLIHWVPRMCAFLRLLADDFQKVQVYAAVGNHGRMSVKPIYKNRAQNNVEWLFWHWVADRLAASGDERITFDISNGLRGRATIYDTRYMLEHGDEFKGGSGISGAKAPLSLGQHRAAVQQLAMGLPLDWMVVGHFHQYQAPSQGLVMGGSLKGYDEYAAGKHFRPERPQQGFWITSAEHGPTISAPIFCDDRAAEGW